MKIWSVIYPILLYYVGCSIGSFLCPIGLPMVFGACVIFPIFKSENIQIVMSREKTGLIQHVSGGTRRPVYKKDMPLLILLGMVAALFFNILFALLQITASSQQYTEVASKQFAFPLWVGILVYGLISPLAEEMVFRGIVYNRLNRFFSKMIAITGSALLFGLYHGNIVQASYGFIIGLLIAFFYERYKSFVVPVLLHSAANVCVYIVSSSAVVQSKLMNWTGCIACGILTIVLFWMLVYRKESKADQNS